MSIKNVKNVTKISWGTVGSVAVGIALFGGILYGIRKLPDNAATAPVKQAANIVS